MAQQVKKLVEDKKGISLKNLKERIAKEDPKGWNNDTLKKCLSELRLSAAGTKEELSNRVCRLKKNPELLDKLIEKQTNTFEFKTRLFKSDIPPPEAQWLSDTASYPKVSEDDVQRYQKLKRHGSEGQYRKALRMFNSRRVKTIKVLKDGNKVFVKANIHKSFSNGITRQAIILFRNGKPSQGHCECAVGLSGICCHVICILLYLEHFSKTGTKFLSLTCTQKLQRWHRRGRTTSTIRTRLFHLPISHFRNLRSSRKNTGNFRTKRKVNKDQVINETSIDFSDWMKRDINDMVSKIETGIKGTQINIENQVYTTLKKHGLNSGLFGQLNYNHHYRVKQALEYHDYVPGLFDPAPLKPKFTQHKDIWHVPLQTNADVDTGTTTGNFSDIHDTIDTEQKPIYEYPEIKQKVVMLQAMIANSKNDADSKKDLKEPDVLYLSIPKWPKLKPFGYNYHAVEQNSKEWLDLRIGKVTCSSIGNLIGLSGEKEHLHILTCITNNIDPCKVKPKKFQSFARGHKFENEAREAFETSTGVPVSTCGYFSHPNDNKYGGSPDGIGPAYLLEIKTRVAGSKSPLTAITADHLLQTNFQMAVTGAAVTFLQSYLPEEKCSNVFLIERNNLLLDVVKMVIDHMIANTTVTYWAHEENNLLKKVGEQNLNKVPTFASLRPLRAWIRKEAAKVKRVHFT